MDNLTYKLAFSTLKGLNLTLGKKLLSLVGDEEQFFRMTESQLKSIVGMPNKLFDRSLRDKALETAKIEADYISINKITPLYFSEPDYPQRLNDCDDAPLMLYGLGNCDLNSKHIISIVGTRHATSYGISFVGDLVSELSKRIDNIVIVSGLAYGIDITAHRASLNCGAPTVAVMAHGLSTIYPPVHRTEAVKIAQGGGMLLTEYRHTAPVHKGNFLARNRIVAGLSDCVIVAESAKKGGALVTAKIASGYNRDVFALPGRTSDLYSSGCNSLIANNVAALIEDADDLIRAMRWQARMSEGTQRQLCIDLTPEEKQITDYLREWGEARVNVISVELDIPVGVLMSHLVNLEFKGAIINFPGGLYRLA